MERAPAPSVPCPQLPDMWTCTRGQTLKPPPPMNILQLMQSSTWTWEVWSRMYTSQSLSVSRTKPFLHTLAITTAADHPLPWPHAGNTVALTS
jgi:hypothetical protein